MQLNYRPISVLNFSICESAVGKLFKLISSWIGNHGMALNVARTESMVISTRPKLASWQGQRIQITHNGTAIKSIHSHKLLGLLLDELTY